MNKVYRSVWNATTNTWAAAAETAKSRSKGSARVVRTAVAAIALGGASMTGAFAAEVDTAEEDEKPTQTVAVSQAPSTGTIGTGRTMSLMGGATIAATGDYAAGGGVIGATGGNNTSIGAGSNIPFYTSGQDVSNAVAIGGATVSNAGIGATAVGSIGIGSGASAGGGGAIVIGAGASNGNSNAIAIGANSRSAGGGGTVTLGASSTTTASGAVAVGSNSRTTGANSASVGANTGTSRGNAFSVGNDLATNADGSARTAFTRQVVNVAAGTQATDAVNLGQMNTALSTKVDNTYFKVNASANSATASGANAVAIGQTVLSEGSSSTAIGSGTTASGTHSVALGASATNATGLERQTAVGGGTSTGAYRATAVGAYASAQAASSVALGDSASVAAGATDSVALGKSASVNTNVTNAVALGAGSVATANNTVSVGAVGSERKIVNVAAGTQATDAVNLAQLSTKVDNDYVKVGAGQNPAAVATTAGRAGNIAIGSNARSLVGSLNSASIAVGEDSLANDAGSVALGTASQSTGSGSVAVGLRAQATGRNSVAIGGDSIASEDRTFSVGNTGVNGQRRIVNVDAGTLSSNSTDAVNGSQLYTTNGRVTTAEGNITTLQQQIGNGTVGLVQQAASGSNLTVGKDTNGAAVDFTNNASQQRKLVGVAAGTVSTTSREAINGSQLRGVSDSVASAIGAGSTVNADGSISAPSFTVGDGSGGTTIVRNVGAAVTNLNDRVTTNEGDITTLQQQVGAGTIGLVQQAGAGGNLTVGKSTDGAAVDFTNNASQQRKLIGVAAGTVSTTSREAINGSQLRGVSDSVASAIGAGSTVNADGSISAPSFTVGDGSGGTTIVRNVGAAVTNLNDRVTTNEGDITSIRNDLSSGSIGLVQQASAGAELTVGKNTDGAVVNFAGTAGDRRLHGVANGTADNDAASIAQLKAMGLFDPNNGRALAAVVYDDIDLKNVTLGGTGGTYLNNVAPGLIASGSMQAVNGSQLYDLDQKLEGYYSNLDGRVGAIEAGGTGGGAGGGGKDPGDFSGSGTGSTQLGAGADASGSNSSAIGNGSSASGSGGTAIGQGSSASGSGGTAIGQGSSATHDNSVALGAGSTTDRDNSVSVGSAGAERQITNVAAGTAPTDAVNVQQLNNTVHSARQDAMGGVAAAMAVAGLPQSTLPGRTFMAISGSTYGNEYGTAIGASYMTKDGKWVVKGAVNTSSRGEVGAVVGGGFYW